LELKLEAEDGLKPVTDRELLMLILQNLLSNAIKYTPSGTIRLTAKCTEAHHSCVISVSDPGPGIPEDKIAKIFAPFRVAKRTASRAWGLGFSLHAKLPTHWARIFGLNQSPARERRSISN